MLTTLAAFQLFLLAQVPPPTLVGPDDARAEDAGSGAATSPARAVSEAPDAPPAAPEASRSAPTAPTTTSATTAATTPTTTPATTVSTPPPAKPPRPPIPSLQSAEPLRSASATFAWAGWPSFGGAYAVGVTQQDDLGAVLDFNWATTELRLGGFYRRPFDPTGGWDFAFRGTLSWYAAFGSSWIYPDNHADRGFEVAPALVFSRRAGGGVFSIAGEAPMTVTVRNGGGFLFQPKLAGSYEMPLMDGVTIGARTAIGYRAGAGDAPLKEGRGLFEFLVLASWQLL
jgi:hypothetical protein